MNRKPILEPIAIRSLQRAVREVEALNRKLPKRIVVTQEVYDRLYEEVKPYLTFKATKNSGTWFCGTRLEVGEANELVLKELTTKKFSGGTPGGKP